MKLSTDHIKNVVTGYLKNKPVKKAWLFGSYARGDADETSDVDVLIDFDENSKIGLEYLTWHEDLEDIIHKKVDIISNKGLSKYIIPFVEKDKELIYEK